MKKEILHEPVMVDEVIEFLRLENGYKVLDGTIGCGGHASVILEKIQPDGFLIGIDKDSNALAAAKDRLNKFGGKYTLVNADSQDIDKVLSDLGVDKIDAALFDLGISSYQIEDESRGFSFEREGFLDMRMDPSRPLRAYDIVNKYSGERLEGIIRDFGQERYFRKITKFILERRRKKPIETTFELSGLVKEAIGRRYKNQKIHPATRTFQALRIAVNDELGALEAMLEKPIGFLRPGARMCVISFHSLEDRVVKIRFKEFEKQNLGRIITKKPLTPAHSEVRKNPRARSAKLRVFEKGK